MKEQLISYNTALLAKEKGFDIPVRYGVYGKKMKLSQSMGWERHPELELVNWNAKTKQQRNSKATSVPTQGLLQKWLREEHNIHITIWYNELTEKYRIDTPEELDEIEYKTYEEALEEGLKEALKLI